MATHDPGDIKKLTRSDTRSHYHQPR